MSQVIRPDAQLDVDKIAAHLEGNVSGLGSRFLRQLEATLTHLEFLPGLGTPYPLLVGLGLVVMAVPCEMSLASVVPKIFQVHPNR